MKKQIEKFYELTGYRLIVKDGKPYYGGSLDLRDTGITSLPDNLTVGGWLDLRGTGITSLPDNLTVGGWLDLRDTGITSLPDNLTVGGWLDLQGTGITSLPDNLTVGGWLDLRGTGITSLPDNLTVGGDLYLRGTGITSLPDNLTVGGDLDLRDTGIRDISKVGAKLPPDALERIDKKRNQILKWEWNEKTYIKADGIFSLVLSQHGKVYRVQQIGEKKTSYLVTDGENRWSHGETIKEARQDLIYKISSRDTSRYNDMTLDSELIFEECIACYRIITGACAAGTRDYIENRLPKPRKEKYTIREMINLTKNEYKGKTFEEFFKNKN